MLNCQAEAKVCIFCLSRSAVSQAKLWMTPHSVQSVPDRCITRLRHTQSGTRGRRVKDLSLRAIQISCTLFHPLHCLSLALFSVWMSVLFFFFSDVSPTFLYTSSGAMIEPPPPLRYLSKMSLWTSVSTPLFSISCFYSLPCFPYFPSLPMWDGAFSLASELHKWHWRRVGVRLRVSHPCVSESHHTVWLHSKQYSAAESFHQTLCDPGVNTWFQAIFQLTVLFCCFFFHWLSHLFTHAQMHGETKTYLNWNQYEIIIVIVVATYDLYIQKMHNLIRIRINLISSVSVFFSPMFIKLAFWFKGSLNLKGLGIFLETDFFLFLGGSLAASAFIVKGRTSLI